MDFRPLSISRAIRWAKKTGIERIFENLALLNDSI